MPESITVNGTNLATLVRNVESLTGLLTAPVRRGENIVVPRRHGALLTSAKLYEQGEIVLPMWVVGANPANGVTQTGDTGITSFYARIDELVRLFHTPTVTIVHTLPDGSARQAVCEVSEVMDFSRVEGAPLTGKVAVALRIPGAFWTDTADVTQSFTVATGTTLSLTNFSAATAPMDELQITFGQSSNPRIQQGSVSLQVNKVIGSTQTVVIGNVGWSVSATGGLSVLMSDVVHTGSARLFELAPGSPPQVVFTHTGGGSRTVTFTGRRKYLAG